MRRKGEPPCRKTAGSPLVSRDFTLSHRVPGASAVWLAAPWLPLQRPFLRLHVVQLPALPQLPAARLQRLSVPTSARNWQLAPPRSRRQWPALPVVLPIAPQCMRHRPWQPPHWQPPSPHPPRLAPSARPERMRSHRPTSPMSTIPVTKRYERICARQSSIRLLTEANHRRRKKIWRRGDVTEITQGSMHNILADFCRIHPGALCRRPALLGHNPCKDQVEAAVRRRPNCEPASGIPAEFATGRIR